MAVESNYPIAIAALTDRLKNSVLFFSKRQANRSNQSHIVPVVFPTLRESYK